MTSIIGMDPHPGHHAAAALNTQGEVQRVEEFPNSPEGLEAFLAWLGDLGCFKLAMEGATQAFFAPWFTRLSARGHTRCGQPHSASPGATGTAGDGSARRRAGSSGAADRSHSPCPQSASMASARAGTHAHSQAAGSAASSKPDAHAHCADASC